MEITHMTSGICLKTTQKILKIDVFSWISKKKDNFLLKEKCSVKKIDCEKIKSSKICTKNIQADETAQNVMLTI